MNATTLCECGHAANEHTGPTSLGTGPCCHDRTSARPSCDCKAFGAARICPGCGGDGLDYAVSDRRRQLARRSVHLGSDRGAVTDCPGIAPVERPFIDSIRRLEHLVRTCNYRLAHDIHVLITFREAFGEDDQGRVRHLPPVETPKGVPDLVFAAWGVYPDEMCKTCWGTGRASSLRFPEVESGVRRMEAEVTTAQDIQPAGLEVG